MEDSPSPIPAVPVGGILDLLFPVPLLEMSRKGGRADKAAKWTQTLPA